MGGFFPEDGDSGMNLDIPYLWDEQPIEQRPFQGRRSEYT
jgi:hypothetical protein